jgi:hypothetical protein
MNIFLNFFTEDENLSLSYWHSVIYHQLSITIEVGCRFKKKMLFAKRLFTILRVELHSYKN